MGNKMQHNFEAIKHPTGSLKESVDAIRTSVKDLYDLDEDNYQMIRNLQKALDESNNRLNAVTRKTNAGIRRITLGGLLLTGIVYGGAKLIRDLNKRVNLLEAQIEATKPEEKEESDG